MTQQVQVPTKEQAIVIDAIEGISVHGYTRAVATVSNPAYIRFVPRISHGRICIYLNSNENADKLTENFIKMNIGNEKLSIWPLISKASRIIISNACPIIPHHVILEELQKLGIQRTSNITYIRAGHKRVGHTKSKFSSSTILLSRRYFKTPTEYLHKLRRYSIFHIFFLREISVFSVQRGGASCQALQKHRTRYK